MIGLLKLAFRNIKRHPVKNLLVAVVIFLTNMVFLLTGSFTEETIISWKKYFASTFLGWYHLTTFSEADKDYTLPSLTFPQKDIHSEVLGYLKEQKIEFLPRIKLGAVIFNEATGNFEGGLVSIVGVNWKEEIKKHPNLKLLSSNGGSALANINLEDGVLVWKDLAIKQNWKIGDVITIYMKDKFAGTYPYSYPIIGILDQKQSAGIENKGLLNVFPLIFVDLDYLEKQLGIDSPSIYEIAITQANLSSEQLGHLHQLSKKFNLTFYSSEKGFGAIYGIVDFTNFVGRSFKILILVILVVSVFNLNMMGVFERQKEIGTLIAIGAKREWVLLLLLLENIIFASIVFVVTVLFYSSFSYLQPSITMGNFAILFAGSDFNVRVIPQALVESYLSIIIAFFISGIYPAYMAAKMQPVEIFREANI